MILGRRRVYDPRLLSQRARENGKSPPLCNFREFKTSHFGWIDYVLPSQGLRVIESKVFRPGKRELHHDWFSDRDAANAHRPVWADVEVR